MSIHPANRAIDIINAAPNQGPLKAPIQYADALPDEAAGLRDLLRSPDITTISKSYVLADRLALRAQSQFRSVAWVAAYAGLLAAVLGGLLFFLSALAVGRAHENVVWGAQYVCLAVALLGSYVLSRGKPSLIWREQRGMAELARRDFYARLMAAVPPRPRGDSPLLLSLKLECFRRHLLTDQLEYFQRRGREDKRTAGGWTAIRFLAMALIAGAAVPMLAQLDTVSWLPERVRELLALVPLKGDTARKSYWLAGLVGGYLQGFLTLASSISPAERNAEKYAAMTKVLTAYVEYLPEVRAAAARSDREAVTTYTQLILADLAMEACDWDAWHPVRLEMALKLLAQPRMAPPGGGAG